MPNAFFCFDGGELVHLGSIIHHVGKFLREQGFSVCITRELGGTRIGEDIRKTLLQNLENPEVRPLTRLYLKNAARFECRHDAVLPSLKRNMIVLCEGSLVNDLVYEGHLGDLSQDYIIDEGILAMAGCFPRMTFLFCISDEEVERRLKEKDGRLHNAALYELLRKEETGFRENYKNQRLPYDTEVITADKLKEERLAELASQRILELLPSELRV